jgi:hypothetical protein
MLANIGQQFDKLLTELVPGDPAFMARRLTDDWGASQTRSRNVNQAT